MRTLEQLNQVIETCQSRIANPEGLDNKMIAAFKHGLEKAQADKATLQASSQKGSTRAQPAPDRTRIPAATSPQRALTATTQANVPSTAGLQKKTPVGSMAPGAGIFAMGFAKDLRLDPPAISSPGASIESMLPGTQAPQILFRWSRGKEELLKPGEIRNRLEDRLGRVALLKNKEVDKSVSFYRCIGYLRGLKLALGRDVQITDLKLKRKATRTVFEKALAEARK